jgi:hypothetical protein
MHRLLGFIGTHVSYDLSATANVLQAQDLGLVEAPSVMARIDNCDTPRADGEGVRMIVIVQFFWSIRIAFRWKYATRPVFCLCVSTDDLIVGSVPFDFADGDGLLFRFVTTFPANGPL